MCFVHFSWYPWQKEEASGGGKKKKEEEKKKEGGGSKVAIIKREGKRGRDRDCTFHNHTTFSLASDFQLQ